MFATRSARAKRGLQGGHEGVDDDFVAGSDVGIGATIIEHNMFGPIRGPWQDQSLTGWWGESPPFHNDVWVLTYHRRESLTMEWDDNIPLHQRHSRCGPDNGVQEANGDVMLGGGAATIQQFLRVGLIDEMHVVIVPIMLGDGERLFNNPAGRLDQYECVELVSSNAATHARIT